MKRKRRDVAAGKVLAIYRPMPSAKRRRTSFVQGVDRTGGFYGRYGHDGELKFFDFNAIDAIVAPNGTITGSIINIAQGVTESQRIGRKCTIRSMHWQASLTLPGANGAASPPASDRVRVIVYLDRQCNGAAAAIGDILALNIIDSFRNLANQGRFQLLHDKFYPLNYQTLSSDNAGTQDACTLIKNFSFYKKLNIPIEYSGTTGAIGEIRSNNIGILLEGQVGVAGFNGRIRFRFSDR